MAYIVLDRALGAVLHTPGLFGLDIWMLTLLPQVYFLQLADKQQRFAMVTGNMMGFQFCIYLLKPYVKTMLSNAKYCFYFLAC